MIYDSAAALYKLLRKHSYRGIFKKIKDKNGREYKAYENAQGGYACMDFDAKTGVRLEYGLVPKWKYVQNKYLAQDVIRIFKKDILFNKKTREFWKVQQLKAEGVKLILPTEVNGNLKTMTNIKDYIVVRDRADIAKIKKEYEHPTSH